MLLRSRANYATLWGWPHTWRGIVNVCCGPHRWGCVVSSHGGCILTTHHRSCSLAWGLKHSSHSFQVPAFFLIMKVLPGPHKTNCQQLPQQQTWQGRTLPDLSTNNPFPVETVKGMFFYYMIYWREPINFMKLMHDLAGLNWPIFFA